MECQSKLLLHIIARVFRPWRLLNAYVAWRILRLRRHPWKWNHLSYDEDKKWSICLVSNKDPISPKLVEENDFGCATIWTNQKDYDQVKQVQQHAVPQLMTNISLHEGGGGAPHISAEEVRIIVHWSPLSGSCEVLLDGSLTTRGTAWRTSKTVDKSIKGLYVAGEKDSAECCSVGTIRETMLITLINSTWACTRTHNIGTIIKTVGWKVDQSSVKAKTLGVAGKV